MRQLFFILVLQLAIIYCSAYHTREMPSSRCTALGEKYCYSCGITGTCVDDGSGGYNIQEETICSAGTSCSEPGIGEAACTSSGYSFCTSCGASTTCIADVLSDNNCPDCAGNAYIDCATSSPSYIKCEDFEKANVATCACEPDASLCGTPCEDYYVPGDGCGTGGYYFCGTGEFYPSTCDNGCFNTTGCNCYVDSSLTCPTCGLKPDPANPDGYIDCSLGVDIFNDCGAGESFSVAICDCDPVDGNATTPSPGGCNTINPSCEFTVDATDCTKFTYCPTGKSSDCASEGTCFNLYSCNCFACPACGKKEDAANSQNYIPCEFGVDESPKSCGDQYFDADKCECVVDEPTTPAVTTPDVTTPAVTTPAVTTPAVTTPVVTTPAVTTPDVTTPAVTTPAVTTPDVATPDVTTPAVTTPVVTTPAVTTPDVTTPAVTTPDVTTPEVTTPAVTTPEVTTPAVTTPVSVTLPATCPDDCNFVENTFTEDECADYYKCTNNVPDLNELSSCNVDYFCYDPVTCSCQPK